MAKLPMTAPAAPAPGTRMATSTPVVSKTQSSQSARSGTVSGGGRNEAFTRGHTAKVHTPAQAHHTAKMRGGSGC